MSKYDYFARPDEPTQPDCEDCGDYGFVWRVPDGFNPFYAGGFRTADTMYKVPCRCAALSNPGAPQ